MKKMTRRYLLASITAGAGLGMAGPGRIGGQGKSTNDGCPLPPHMVKPTLQQLAWQEMEFIAFVHFTVNTFTDKEWGEGTEDPAIFNPSSLDARQWARVARDAGMKMIILTAKHHDGFCLWPSAFTDHSVKNSPWRKGKGDVVREASEACMEFGLKFGVYLSPWDRHEPSYGTNAYNQYYKNQLCELLTNYSEITEVWLDGAKGKDAKDMEYDFDGYFSLVKKLQPNAVIAIMGRDVRWVGNEDGLARESEWSVIPKGVNMQAPDLGSRAYLNNAGELVWYPAECDVSIRPGWFYHASQDEKVKSLEHLLDIYYRSVGRNSVLLLNIPPDRRGLFHENDVARLKEFRSVLDETFAVNLAAGKPVTVSNVRYDNPAYSASHITDGNADTYWTTDDSVRNASFEIDLGESETFDRIELGEYIRLGQRVESFAVEGLSGGAWRGIAEGTTIGYKRLMRIPEVTASKIRVTITDSRHVPMISGFGLYRASDREIKL